MTGRPTPLGAGGEFDAIRALLARLGPNAAGVGDDAATIDIPPGERLVASVDSSVELVHFRRPWLRPAEIGYRAVTAALSDLAAMAAAPSGVLVALSIPDDWRADLPALADGIGEAVAAAHTVVLGGNLSAAGELTITTTVLGHARTVLRRDGVRIGHSLYVTGRLGAAGASLRALLAGTEPAVAHRARFAHPVARIAEAQWLEGAGASAAIDISDGLAADAGHLAAASGVRLEVDLGLVPLSAGVSATDAAASGEEYELLVSAPAALDAAAFEQRFGIPLTLVGKAVPGEPAEAVMLQGGRRVAVAAGYDHLSR